MEEGAVQVVRVQLAAADAALRVQIKVDENRLRRQTTDLLPAILVELQAEKDRLKPILEARRLS